MQKRKPSLYEWLLFIVGCSLCLFILTEVIIMALIPTNPDNVEIRKQMMSIINFLSGGIMGILSTKLLDKK